MLARTLATTLCVPRVRASDPEGIGRAFEEVKEAIIGAGHKFLGCPELHRAHCHAASDGAYHVLGEEQLRQMKAATDLLKVDRAAVVYDGDLAEAFGAEVIADERSATRDGEPLPASTHLGANLTDRNPGSRQDPARGRRSKCERI